MIKLPIGLLRKQYMLFGKIYDAGSQQTSRLVSAVSMGLMIVGIWKPTLEYYGIPILGGMLLLIVVYIAFNFVVGAYVFKSGMYSDQLDVDSNRNRQWQLHLELNKKIDSKMDAMASDISEMRTRIDKEKNR